MTAVAAGGYLWSGSDYRHLEFYYLDDPYSGRTSLW